MHILKMSCEKMPVSLLSLGHKHEEPNEIKKKQCYYDRKWAKKLPKSSKHGIFKVQIHNATLPATLQKLDGTM